MVLATTPTHPVLACAAAVRQAVKDAAESDPMFMSVEDKERALLQLSTAVDQLQALRLSVLAAADRVGDVADHAHARNAASWVTATHHDGGELRREAWQARLLHEHPAMRAALSAGTLNLAQAYVIGHALRELDRAVPDLDQAIRQQAVDHLIDAAARHTPEQLRVLGRRILDVIDPDVADEYERRRLEDEDKRARRRTYFATRRNGDGITDTRGRVPDAVAARLQRYLDAFTNPAP